LWWKILYFDCLRQTETLKWISSSDSVVWMLWFLLCLLDLICNCVIHTTGGRNTFMFIRPNLQWCNSHKSPQTLLCLFI